MAQSCRAGMARLPDLEEKAEKLEAELASQQDMEDKVNKLNTLISDRLQNAANECDSFRARFEHLKSQLKTAMGDRTHIHDELQKLNDEAKNTRAEPPAEKGEAPHRDGEIEGNEEDVALTNARTKRMRVTSDSCRLAATAGQRLKARERSMVDESRLPVRAVEARVACVYFARTLRVSCKEENTNKQTHNHTLKHTHKQTKQTHKQTHTQTHTHKQTHTQTHTNTQTHTQTYTHTNTHNTNTHQKPPKPPKPLSPLPFLPPQKNTVHPLLPKKNKSTHTHTPTPTPPTTPPSSRQKSMPTLTRARDLLFRCTRSFLLCT